MRDFTIVYRYSSRMISQKSRLATANRIIQLRERFLMLFPAFRRWRADAHAVGLTENSPFVSVVLDPHAIANSPEAGARAIVTGRPEWALKAYGLQQAEDLGIFRVPTLRLYLPHPARKTQNLETERLFWGDDLETFLLEWLPNPYMRR